MSIKPDFSKIDLETKAHIKELNALAKEYEKIGSDIKKSGSLDGFKLLFKDICHRSETASSLLNQDIKQLNTFGSQSKEATKTTLLAHSCLGSLGKAMSQTAQFLQEKTYELLEKAASSTPENAQLFIEHADLLLGMIFKIPENRLYAHLCLEKAGSIFEDTGEFQKAIDLRLNILKQLGPPSALPVAFASAPPQGILCNGFDSGGLKQGALLLKKRTFKGEGTRTTLSAHMTPHLTQKARRTAALIKNDPMFLSNELKTKVTCMQVPNGYSGPIDDQGTFSPNLQTHGLALGSALQIHLEGIGTITLTEDDKYLSLRNRIEFNIFGDLSEEEAMHKLHFLSTLIGCGPILERETPLEDQRKQIALLCYVFAPRETYKLQESPLFYECSPEQLKTLVLKEAPHMKPYFQKYLNDSSRMRKISSSPTTTQWIICNLSKKLRKQGAIGLFAGTSGNIDNLISKLTSGSLSSQARFEEGKTSITGASSDQDHEEGGAGHVFVRMITEKMLYVSPGERPTPISFFPFAGHIQLLIDLSALDGGAYAYPSDRWGSKKPKHYAQRESLLELTSNLNNQSSAGNEYMVSRKIAPDKIIGLVVPNQELKDALIEHFQKQGLTIEKKGKLYLGSHPSTSLNDFIRIGTFFDKKMWS